MTEWSNVGWNAQPHIGPEGGTYSRPALLIDSEGLSAGAPVVITRNKASSPFQLLEEIKPAVQRLYLYKRHFFNLGTQFTIRPCRLSATKRSEREGSRNTAAVNHQAVRLHELAACAHLLSCPVPHMNQGRGVSR